MKARGLIVDLDSIVKGNIDELLSLIGSNTWLQPEDAPPHLLELKDRLNVARGFRIVIESGSQTDLVGSAIFTLGIACDGYVGAEFGTSTLDRLLKFAFLFDASEWIYLSGNSINLSEGQRLDFIVRHTDQMLVEPDLPFMPVATRPDPSEETIRAQVLRYREYKEDSINIPLLPGSIVQLGQLDDLPRLHTLLSSSLPKVFPARAIANLDNALAFVNYYDDGLIGKQLLEEIKNWRSRKSGPQPNLLNVNFLSAVLASRIVNSGAEAIVPVPSTSFSGAQPAMVSVRLAHSIAILLGLPCYEVLHKTRKHEFGTLATLGSSPILGKKVALIDDQITTGKSMHLAREILVRELEAKEVVCLAWSTTKSWARPTSSSST